MFRLLLALVACGAPSPKPAAPPPVAAPVAAPLAGPIDEPQTGRSEQNGIAVSVLLDEANTGNGAASMFEVRMAPKATTGARLAERAELWYFLTEGEVKGLWSSWSVELFRPAGTLVYVPKGAIRAVTATKTELRAIVVVVPGGRETSALPSSVPSSTQGGEGYPEALVAKKYGDATIYLDPKITAATPLSASMLVLYAGAKLAEHVHTNETEILYVLEGTGTITIAGSQSALTPTSVFQIPKNTKHAFTATTAIRALQIYTPPGPEQRLKK